MPETERLGDAIDWIDVSFVERQTCLLGGRTSNIIVRK